MSEETKVTTNYDELIEKAYKQDYFHVICNSDELYRYCLNGVNLFKIHGDCEHLDNLVICDSDYREFPDGPAHSLMWNSLINELATKHVVFVGYSLEDSNILSLIDKIRKTIAQKEMYLVSPHLTQMQMARLQKYNVNFIQSDGLSFLNSVIFDLRVSYGDHVFIYYNDYHELYPSTKISIFRNYVVVGRNIHVYYLASKNDRLKHVIEKDITSYLGQEIMSSREPEGIVKTFANKLKSANIKYENGFGSFDLYIKLSEDKKMGLELSDTAYYNVDDGVNDEPLYADDADRPHRGSSGIDLGQVHPRSLPEGGYHPSVKEKYKK